jgi:hypothetical protein
MIPDGNALVAWTLARSRCLCPPRSIETGQYTLLDSELKATEPAGCRRYKIKGQNERVSRQDPALRNSPAKTNLTAKCRAEARRYEI